MPVGRFHFDPGEVAILGLELEEGTGDWAETEARFGPTGDPGATDIATVFGVDGIGMGAGRNQTGISSVPQAKQNGQDLRLVWPQTGQVCNQKPVVKDKVQFWQRVAPGRTAVWQEGQLLTNGGSVRGMTCPHLSQRETSFSIFAPQNGQNINSSLYPATGDLLGMLGAFSVGCPFP